MYSLRSRLLTGMIGGMILLLIIFDITIYSVIQKSLLKEFDSSLANTARMLAAAIENKRDEIELEFDVRMTEFNKSDRPAYYQFWHSEGRVLDKSPSLDDDDLLLLRAEADRPVYQDMQLRDGRPGRAIGIIFTPRTELKQPKTLRLPAEQQNFSLVVARDTLDIRDNLRFLRWLLMIASTGVIFLSFIVAAVVVRKGLGPLSCLAAEIASIKEDILSKRIEINELPAEIAPIKERLNNLLARLEVSFERERQFTADVAHELRTPLAGLRATIEVTLMNERNAKEYQDSLSECLAISKNMQKMTENILVLTRIEGRQITFPKVRIELRRLTDSCWQRFANKAADRNIVFENRLAADLTFESEPESLQTVFSNLLDNAVEYSNKGGRVWITAEQTDRWTEITVCNTGCTLNNEEVARVFDRFWRQDRSRTDANVRSGLGLALVKRLIAALGGNTTARVTDESVFALQISLPADASNCQSEHK